MLARIAGPDRAMAVLEECGVQVVLSPHSKLVCELLRVAEKRQRWVRAQVTKLLNKYTRMNLSTGTYLSVKVIKMCE